jgi:hypothetical protein
MDISARVFWRKRDGSRISGGRAHRLFLVCGKLVRTRGRIIGHGGHLWTGGAGAHSTRENYKGGLFSQLICRTQDRGWPWPALIGSAQGGNYGATLFSRFCSPGYKALRKLRKVRKGITKEAPCSGAKISAEISRPRRQSPLVGLSEGESIFTFTLSHGDQPPSGGQHMPMPVTIDPACGPHMAVA